jgi:hypothetical protein
MRMTRAKATRFHSMAPLQSPRLPLLAKQHPTTSSHKQCHALGTASSSQQAVCRNCCTAAVSDGCLNAISMMLLVK